MPGGVQDALLHDAIDPIDQRLRPRSRGVRQPHPHTDLPLLLDTAAQFLEACVEPRHRKIQRLLRERAEAPDERTHLELAVLELILHVCQALPRAIRIAVEQSPGRDELQGASRGRLEQAVVDVARHAETLFQRRRLAEPPQQVKAVEPRHREPCYDFSENQIVDPHGSLVQREKPPPDKLAVQAPGLDPLHVKSRLQGRMNRPSDALTEGYCRPVHDGPVLVARAGCLKTPTLQTRNDERSVRRFGLRRDSYVPPRTPGEVDRSVLGLLPDDYHSRCLEHLRALAHELGGKFGRLSRNATRPSDEASELALKTVMMSAEVSDEHGDDGDLHDPNEERVHDEGAHVKEERGVRVRSRVENDRRDRRPHGTAALPSKRAADYQEGEVREERTAWRVSKEIEEREGREVEAMLGDAPAGRKAHRRPYQCEY